jgi:uridine kinase
MRFPSVVRHGALQWLRRDAGDALGKRTRLDDPLFCDMTDAKENVFQPAHLALANRLLDLLMWKHSMRSRKARTVIAIAGESGSGKSVTALCLARALFGEKLPATVLHQDDYLRLPPVANQTRRAENSSNVGPHEVDFDTMRAHVAAFRSGQNNVPAPRADPSGQRFDTVRRDFADLALLIVEGTYVLSEIESDIRIFLSATSDESRERGRGRNRDGGAAIVDRALAIEHPIIAAQNDLADIVIDRNFGIVRTSRRPV